MTDIQRFWSFLALAGILVLLVLYAAASAQSFRVSSTEEKDYVYGFFMTSVPTNFVVWALDSSKLKIQGTVGYNAIFLLARGDDKLRDVRSIAGAGIGTIVGYGERPVIGIAAVLLISEINTFIGYDFFSRGVVIGAGYTVAFPFPKRAYITLWKKEVIQ